MHKYAVSAHIVVLKILNDIEMHALHEKRDCYGH